MIDSSAMILNFGYDSTEIDDIKKCLVTLYGTKEGTQPLDREFGLNYDFIGIPLDVAKSRFILEIVAKTRKYEPRASVESVDFEYDENEGKLYPTVNLVKGDG